MSGRVTGVKTAFGELHGACNRREAFLSSSLLQGFCFCFSPQGQGSLRRNNLEHKWTLTPWLWPSYPTWNSVFSYLRWAHQFLPWMMSAQSDSQHMVGVQQGSSCLSFASVCSVRADWPSSLSLQLYPLSHLNVLTDLAGHCSVAMWPWQIPFPLWTSVSLSVLRDDYIG